MYGAEDRLESLGIHNQRRVRFKMDNPKVNETWQSSLQSDSFRFSSICVIIIINTFSNTLGLVDLFA